MRVGMSGAVYDRDDEMDENGRGQPSPGGSVFDTVAVHERMMPAIGMDLR